MLVIIQAIVEQGLIFTLLIAAAHVTAQVLRFDDLTLEGSFGLGGALCAFGIVSGWGPKLSLLIGIAAGAIAGLITGLLHTKLKINNLISGIIVTTGAYTINLLVAGSHLPLPELERIIDAGHVLFHAYGNWASLGNLCVLVPIALGCLFLVQWLLSTEVGFFLRACGSSRDFVERLGKSSSWFLCGGLMFANALVGLAGGLFVQYNGFFSVSSSIGILIIALAGLMLGRLVASHWQISALIGGLAYPTMISTILLLALSPVWNKLGIALCMVLLFVLKRAEQKGGVS